MAEAAISNVATRPEDVGIDGGKLEQLFKRVERDLVDHLGRVRPVAVEPLDVGQHQAAHLAPDGRATLGARHTIDCESKNCEVLRTEIHANGTFIDGPRPTKIHNLLSARACWFESGLGHQAISRYWADRPRRTASEHRSDRSS